MSCDPTWDDDIRALFAAPYWIHASLRETTGGRWIKAMKGYFVELDQYTSVKQWALQIYAHLHSRAMPLSADPTEQWPDAALETFRSWANQGYRQSVSDPLDRAERIPRPAVRPLALRLRKDITKLSTAELNEYRSRIDALRVADGGADSPWQSIGATHTNWCLHYQEAFLFWHRANLLWLEERLGIAVPYWNWMSPHAAEPGHVEAGLPAAFIDDTYVHPRTGEVRPNPLRYAAAYLGKSKACADDPAPTAGCKWVHRDPLLIEPNPDPAQYRDKLDQLLIYQEQVRTAFKIGTFSTPQGWPGEPWANIPTFPAPDSEYPYLNETFDGTYEQPHDNLHGWVGPDMADNTYTAFDPVFWSHHAMIDLVFELWIREHPAATYSATFPLRPFLGADARAIDETEPRAFLYTNIGDMARDSRRLGVDFADLPAIRSQLDSSVEGPRLNALFEGVRCTFDSYAIELYLNPPDGELRPTSDNPHFALRMTRLGMGSVDQNNRCIQNGVQRLVDLTRSARRLGIAPGDPCRLVLKVIDLRTARVLSEDETKQLPGFIPRLLWRVDVEVEAMAPAPADVAQAPSKCCKAKDPPAPSEDKPNGDVMKTQSTVSTPVVPTNRFMTPGGQVDFPDDPAKQAALDALWNTNLSGFTAQGITGNPWTTTNSSDQTWYYDPTTVDTSTAGYAQITWSPLPGRITYYFPQLEGTANLFSLADTGKDTTGKSFDPITNNPCNPAEGQNQPFGPYGPRGWQDEYCEWSIERDANGNITRVDFTCENPEYFNSVWLIDPQRVLEIYQTTLAKPQIALEDLYLRNSSGKPVIDPGTGRPAYDPLNKWNRGSASTATAGGAMHLTSTPNTIQTEIGLGSTATTPRNTGNSDIGKLICCAQYGQIGRNSDPNIGAQVNRLVNGLGNKGPSARATLANPPGLYMQPPDFSRFVAPKGDDPSQFWTVSRGNAALVDGHGKQLVGTFFLHATYMVPASKGYTVSDIKIDGMGIQYASQINQTFLMQICGQALPQTSAPSVQPCAGAPTTLLAQPLQLFHKAVFDAMYATTYSTVVDVTANLASNSTMIAPFVRPGDKNVAMTLVASIDGSKPPTVSFGPDVTVTVGAITSVNYAIPGNSYPSSSSAIALTIDVSPTAAPGLRSCQVTNAGQAPSTAMPALLHVVPV